MIVSEDTCLLTPTSLTMLLWFLGFSHLRILQSLAPGYGHHRLKICPSFKATTARDGVSSTFPITLQVTRAVSLAGSPYTLFHHLFQYILQHAVPIIMCVCVLNGSILRGRGLWFIIVSPIALDTVLCS